MSDLENELRAEREIISRATAGPWDHQEAFDASFVCAGDVEQPVSSSWVARIENRPGRTKDKADATFIAHARTALPIRNAQVAKVLQVLDDYEVPSKQDDVTGEICNGMERLEAIIRRAIEEAGA